MTQIKFIEELGKYGLIGLSLNDKINVNLDGIELVHSYRERDLIYIRFPYFKQSYRIDPIYLPEVLQKLKDNMPVAHIYAYCKQKYPMHKSY